MKKMETSLEAFIEGRKKEWDAMGKDIYCSSAGAFKHLDLFERNLIGC